MRQPPEPESALHCGRVHAALLAHIQAHLNEADMARLAAGWGRLSEQQKLRWLFSSYRVQGQATRGLRLTKFGLLVMRQFFAAGYEVSRPADEPLLPAHLLYLDQHANLPYYCDKLTFVLFDQQLTVLLRLCGGRVARLMAINP